MNPPSSSKASSAKVSSSDTFDLHSSFSYWIMRLASAMQEDFNACLEVHGVTWTQWMALNVLHLGKADTPAKIADLIGVDRSAVTRLLDRLADKDLVERHHDGLDRRSVKILLTPKAGEMVVALDAAVKAHQARYLATLPGTELRGLKGNLQKMLKVADVDSQALWKHY